MALDESVLQALLGGAAPVSSGAADINAFNQMIASNDLWSKAGNAIGGVKFDSSTWSPEKTLAASAGQAFLSSILGSIGEDRQRQQFNKMAEVLPALYANPASVAAPEGVDSGAFNLLKMTAIKDEAKRNFAQQEKIKDYGMSVARELFSQRPEQAAKFLGIKEEEQPKENIPVVTDPLSATLRKPGMTTAEKISAYTKEYSKQMPRGAAAEMASKLVAAELKARQSTGNKAQEEREKGQSLINLASEAKAALNKIGETGGFEGPKATRDFILDWITPGTEGDPAAERRIGRSDLDKMASDFIKKNYQKGSAGLNQVEVESLLKSAPNVNAPKESNYRWVEKTKAEGKAKLDYADFIDFYKEINDGDIAKADQKWAEYQAANPLYIDDTLNPNRMSWQEYFSKVGAGEVPTIEKPPSAVSPEIKAAYIALRKQGLTHEQAKAKLQE